MKDHDSSSSERKGLETEIDQAIDRLFVEKGTGRQGAPSTAVGMAGEEPVTRLEPEKRKPPVAASQSSTQAGGAERSLEGQPSSLGGDDQPRRNLESLETHLLSLEWEISPDLIDRIISELGFLKDFYRNNRCVFQVVDMMDHVARSLADDEGNITPERLRFLLEAKDGIKLLSDELKDREDYRNVVLSGILARYQLMGGRHEISAEPQDHPDTQRDFDGLARDLQELSRKLQAEIRHLGSIAQRLEGQGAVRGSSQIFEAALMESGGRIFAIDKGNVVRSLQVPYRMGKTIWRDTDVRIRGVRFPLINLFRLFRFKGKAEARDRVVVLVRKGEQMVAILVDRLLQKREFPLQSIREATDLNYIRGVAPLGRGRTVYFLDIDRMLLEF